MNGRDLSLFAIIVILTTLVGWSIRDATAREFVIVLFAWLMLIGTIYHYKSRS